MNEYSEEVDIDFTYMIFQPNLKKNNISVWIDGAKVKKVYKLPVFEKLLFARNPELYSNVQQVLSSYSFYLISISKPTVKKLDPSSKDALYKDERTNYFTGTVKLTKKEESLVDSLASMGFEPLTEQDTTNLNIGMSNVKQTDFMSSLMNILRRK